MAIENLMKKVKIFSGKVKAASNIATVIFLLALTYFLSQWHKASGFDSFINLLMAAMVLAVNIRFYRIHLELRNAEELTEETEIRLTYKLQKKEYRDWLLASIAIFMILALLKFILI